MSCDALSPDHGIFHVRRSFRDPAALAAAVRSRARDRDRDREKDREQERSGCDVAESSSNSSSLFVRVAEPWSSPHDGVVWQLPPTPSLYSKHGREFSSAATAPSTSSSSSPPMPLPSRSTPWATASAQAVQRQSPALASSYPACPVETSSASALARQQSLERTSPEAAAVCLAREPSLPPFLSGQVEAEAEAEAAAAATFVSRGSVGVCVTQPNRTEEDQPLVRRADRNGSFSSTNRDRRGAIGGALAGGAAAHRPPGKPGDAATAAGPTSSSSSSSSSSGVSGPLGAAKACANSLPVGAGVAAGSSGGGSGSSGPQAIGVGVSGGGGGGMGLGILGGVEPWVVQMIRAVGLIGAWYVFSMCLSLYNKILIGHKHGHFPAPLLMTTFHFMLQYVISVVVLRCCCPPSWSPTTRLSWRDYGMRIVPTAVATAADIGLSNLSLAFITLTFYTMCKSSAPVFLLLFAFAFRLEPLSMKLLGVMTVISVGVLFTVAGETHFQFVGFLLVMASALTSGLRWVLIQVLLQKDKLGLTNPLVTLCYLTPVMALVCAIFSLIREPWHTLHTTPYFDTFDHAMYSLVIMVCGGLLAFMMIMSEFLLVLETSAVTLSVAGTVKEGATILVSHWVFSDRFTRVNLLGIFIIMIGVSLFNMYKFSRAQQREVKPAGHLLPLRTLGDSSGWASGVSSGDERWDERQTLLGGGGPAAPDPARSPSAAALRNHHHLQQHQQQQHQQQGHGFSHHAYGAGSGGSGLTSPVSDGSDLTHVVVATAVPVHSVTMASPRTPATPFVVEMAPVPTAAQAQAVPHERDD